jgi:hypothetical protein
VKKPQCLEKRAARVGVKNIYGFEFLVEFVDLSRITGIVAMAFYLQRVVSELEERTSAFCLLAYALAYALAYVSNQQSGCSRLETLALRIGVYGLLPLRGGR